MREKYIILYKGDEFDIPRWLLWSVLLPLFIKRYSNSFSLCWETFSTCSLALCIVFNLCYVIYSWANCYEITAPPWCHSSSVISNLEGFSSGSIPRTCQLFTSLFTVLHIAQVYQMCIGSVVSCMDWYIWIASWYQCRYLVIVIRDGINEMFTCMKFF